MTRSSLPKALKIAEAIHVRSLNRGMTWQEGTSGYVRTDHERGVHLMHNGHSFTIRIAGGYRQAKFPDPYISSGLVRMRVNGLHRWEQGKRKGTVLEHVP